MWLKKRASAGEGARGKVTVWLRLRVKKAWHDRMQLSAFFYPWRLIVKIESIGISLPIFMYHFHPLEKSKYVGERKGLD